MLRQLKIIIQIPTVAEKDTAAIAATPQPHHGRNGGREISGIMRMRSTEVSNLLCYPTVTPYCEQHARETCWTSAEEVRWLS